ncbi:MAG: FtsX-like permease family protein [Planctomycetes bacterium]|nr:FtsX-like permease family protein [Planctomycetota bacterium]
MRHWSQLGIRNWFAKPGRTAAALAAIALGVGVVVWVTCAYESVRLALTDQVWFWIGRSHLSVESVYGNEGTVYEEIAGQVARDPNIAAVTYRLARRVKLHPLAAAGTSKPAGPVAQPKRPESELPREVGNIVTEVAAAAGLLPSTAPEEGGEELPGQQVQAVGIDPASEYQFRKYDDERVAGRVLAPGDTDAMVVDRRLADELNLRIGDRVRLYSRVTHLGEPQTRTDTFTIVGLLERRQVAKQQLPVVMTVLEPLQRLAGYDQAPKRVTKIDMLLEDKATRSLRATEGRVWNIVNAHRQGFLVSSSEAKLRQVEAAEQQTGFILLLISSVALFTAFFIILSTLSIGMLERIGQLGTLRCLGVTRMQMAMLVLAEAVPLGIVGILLGVPVGLALARLSVWLAPEYIGHFAVSRTGLALALGGGGVTTLAGALLPIGQAIRVSPMVASKPQSRPTPLWFAGAAFVLGVGMILGHTWMIERMPANRWFEPVNALSGVALLYCGYALVTPLLVWLFGQVAVRVAAGMLRVRQELLSDQVGRAAWRSGAICCGLMVGLSLIVSLVVHSQSLAAGWDFPKDFCEAFVFVSPPIPREVANEVRRVRGVATSAVVNESIRCTVYGAGLFHFATSRFVAGDPEEFFNIARLEFKEGNKAEAIAKLKRGGYILVTPEFVLAKKKGYGDKVYIKGSGGRGNAGTFEIAGVVTSPALDIAANYFNAGGMLVAASVHIVMGTLADAHRVFGLPDEASMFLVNFDLPTTTPAYPPEFADEPPAVGGPRAMAELLEKWRPLLPERQVQIDQVLNQYRAYMRGDPGAGPSWTSLPLLQVFHDALGKTLADWDKMTPTQRWQNYREELVMRLITHRSGSTYEQHASVRALKQQIDRDLRRATLLFTSIPMVALIVAALGVGNLMTANVASRTREIAMLRAVGATKWQIVRLVIGEALVLGALGSMLGLALGLHAAHGMNAMTTAIWGFVPAWTIPWDLVLPGIAFTVTVCLIAGMIPARHAARNNVIDALQTT